MWQVQKFVTEPRRCNALINLPQLLQVVYMTFKDLASIQSSSLKAFSSLSSVTLSGPAKLSSSASLVLGAAMVVNGGDQVKFLVRSSVNLTLIPG